MKSSAGQRRHQKDLDRGARIGAATGLPLMAAIYGLYAPTADIRVRIPFLLEMSGGLLIVLILLGFVAIEIMILASTRLLTRWGFTGVVAVSLAYVILLASGNVGRWLPQFNSMGARWGVLVCSIIVATVVIVRTSRAAAV
jgi:hypothetical protein